MRLLVCGGRDFVDVNCLYTALDRVFSERVYPTQLTTYGADEIVSGAARGADSIAAQYARQRGIKLTEVPAKWYRYGKRAGYVRNKAMLLRTPDLVAAFPGGKGTNMMIDLALKAGVTVVQVGRDPLGHVVMGTLGASSHTAVSSDSGIKTKTFQKKYIDRIASFKMLTPGQRDGIYREVAEEERLWFATQDQAALEYEEILGMQELVDKLDADKSS